MPTITSSYPGGQSLTSGRDFPDPAQALVALMSEERRRRRPASAPTGRAGPNINPSAVKMAPTAGRGGNAEGNTSALEDELKRKEIHGRLLQLATMQRQAPTKHATIAGQTFLTMQDPERMSGYERDVFLPKSAQSIEGLGESGASLAASPPAVRGVDTSSPHGYDYLPPNEQLRAFQALLRAQAARR